MIKSILLVDDETLFHLVFEDACSLLDICLTLQAVSSAEEAEKMFIDWVVDPRGKPEVCFIDLNLIGSSFDGIELIDRINNKYGAGVVIGIISSSADPQEIERSKGAGAQFWIVKSDEIEPRLEAFKLDYQNYKSKSGEFKVYR